MAFGERDHSQTAVRARAWSDAYAPRPFQRFEPARALSQCYAGKRALDVVLGVLLIAATLPLMILVWLAVRITSEGPGLHWSYRVGRHGRPFLMPKFRTMAVDAPTLPREAMANPCAHVTWLGHLLREYSVDELPQLFCVVAGSMSLVGPRPLLAADPCAAARRSFPAVLDARPGMTGLAQVSGRNAMSARRKSRYDAFYANRASIGMDLQILARTAPAVLSGQRTL